MEISCERVFLVKFEDAPLSNTKPSLFRNESDGGRNQQITANETKL